jgi:hypothetical protein
MLIKLKYIQGNSRIMLTPTELKMQPTIHLEGKAGCLPRPYPALRSKCMYCGLHFQFYRARYYA